MRIDLDWSKEEKLEVLALKKKYRDCLITLGRSSESHLFELRNSKIYDGYHKEEKKKLAWDFIERLLLLDSELDYLGKKILSYDCLEYGRHYQFWYLSYLNKKGYEKRRKEVLDLLLRRMA